MNKRLGLLLCLLALGIALVPAPEGAARQGPPRVGGFKPVATNNSEVLAAARFAVAEGAKKEEVNLKLVSVETAEYAVVAGMKYRLCLKVEVEGEEENVTTTVKAEVFKSLQKQYQLKGWEAAECGGENNGR